VILSLQTERGRAAFAGYSSEADDIQVDTESSFAAKSAEPS